MRRHKKFLATFLVLLLVAAIAIIIIRPTCLPRYMRPPNNNHRLETMTAMGSWAFTGTSLSGGYNSRFYRPVLAQVRRMYAMFERDANREIVYPSFYGGIAANEGRLTLLIVEGGLEEAKAHEAFSHFFAKNVQHRYVEFSFAQLLEARGLVNEVINSRADCFYAGRALELEPRISACNNRVEVVLSQNNAEGRDLVAGFLKYVFDSPMVDVEATWFLEMWVRRVHPIVNFAYLVLVAYVIIGGPLGVVRLCRGGEKRCYLQVPVK